MRLFTILAAVIALMTITLPSAAAAEDGCRLVGDRIVCSDSGRDTSKPIYTKPGPYPVYRYVPTCDGNRPDGYSNDALCGAATMSCPGPERQIRFWVYRQIVQPGESPRDGAWEMVRTECRGGDEPPEGGPEVITEWMIQEAAQAVAPETHIVSEPDATSYVNVPNNFWVDTATHSETVTLIGVPITITYRPTAYSWSFGDGASDSGPGIRNARVGQDGAVEHQYRRSGDYDVTATRSFEVTAILPGGDSLTLEVPITSTSAPHPLTIGEIQSVVTGVR